MLWHLALSSVPALLILSVGPGAEQLKGAVEQCPPMAGPAAPWLPCSDWPCTSPMARLPSDDPLFCLRRQTGLSNSTQGHFKSCITSCTIGFLCYSWRSLSPGTACCPAALAGHLKTTNTIKIALIRLYEEHCEIYIQHINTSDFLSCAPKRKDWVWRQ